jgi:FkbM family methyltransferase
MNKIKYYIIRILEVIGLLKFINFIFPIKVNNKNFKLPFGGSKIGTENILLMESWFFDIYKELRKVGSLNEAFVDVGMNIGQTILKVKSIDSSVRYIGFEPNVVCINYLFKLVKLNYFDDVHIFPVGLADKNGILTLYADNEFASGATMMHKFRHSQKIKFEYNTPVFTGDEVLFSENPGIIKIDVEGFELEVLKGLSKTLLEKAPFVICEILPNYSNLESLRYSRQIELENLLHSMDYHIFRVIEKESKISHIDSIGFFDSMSETNFVFVPAAKVNQLTHLIIHK